jgi:hypothetical protein
MDEDELPDYDHTDPQVIEARNKVAKAITEYLNAIRPTDAPYVIAWVVAAEWTNPELEQTARAGRDVIAQQEQPISASCGLGMYITNRFG